MNILVVDDEKDMQTLFEQKFRKEIKAHITNFAFASSGEEALAYFNSHVHEIVLILSDINMPGMSGFDLLQYIKHDYPSPPPTVIMITAYSDEENYHKALLLGADDFITKPVDFKLLKEKLKMES